MNKNSQNACIAIWLKQGNTITPIEALHKFGCFRLGARIADLRKVGYDIETKMVEKDGKRFAQYTMKRKCCNCAYADFRYNDAPVGSGESLSGGNNPPSGNLLPGTGRFSESL